LVAGGIPPAIVQPVFVNAVAGEMPTSPAITLVVQVTDAPRIEKSDAAPNDTGAANAVAVLPSSAAVASNDAARYF